MVSQNRAQPAPARVGEARQFSWLSARFTESEVRQSECRRNSPGHKRRRSGAPSRCDFECGESWCISQVNLWRLGDTYLRISDIVWFSSELPKKRPRREGCTAGQSAVNRAPLIEAGNTVSRARRQTVKKSPASVSLTGLLCLALNAEVQTVVPALLCPSNPNEMLKKRTCHSASPAAVGGSGNAGLAR